MHSTSPRQSLKLGVLAGVGIRRAAPHVPSIRTRHHVRAAHRESDMAILDSRWHRIVHFGYASTVTFIPMLALIQRNDGFDDVGRHGGGRPESRTGPQARHRRAGPALGAGQASRAGSAGRSEQQRQCVCGRRRVQQAVDHVDVGVLHINSESAGADPHVPFGGAKRSGLGPKEQGTAAREFFTHTTTVYLRGGAARS